MNCDDATFAVAQSAGVGVVIRDNTGQVVAAMSKRIPYPLGPLESEAMAMDRLGCWCLRSSSV